ncbi:MAG: DUF1566 domain-containing protein [Deltaproteobacteria bacterium]|nr:DUF1566 domain-containing protein [Deltaproteobacteria bacterium]
MKLHIIMITLFSCFFSLTITPFIYAQSNSRFVDNGDETITDTATGLMWKKNTPSPLIRPASTWMKAVKECEELRLGGYSDWRLPTKEEWLTIIDTKNEFPALVTLNPFQNVIVNSPYWTGTEYTFGSNYPCDENGCALYSHVVLLYLGYFGQQRKDKRAFLWPIRSTMKIAKVPTTLTYKKLPAQETIKKRAIAKPLLEEGKVEIILVQQTLLSKEFQLLGFNKEEQVNLGFYLQIPIKKDSKAKIRSREGGIETIFNLYKIDRRVVDLFNHNSKNFGLSVRGMIDSTKGLLIFHEQIP